MPTDSLRCTLTRGGISSTAMIASRAPLMTLPKAHEPKGVDWAETDGTDFDPRLALSYEPHEMTLRLSGRQVETLASGERIQLSVSGVRTPVSLLVTRRQRLDPWRSWHEVGAYLTDAAGLWGGGALSYAEIDASRLESLLSMRLILSRADEAPERKTALEWHYSTSDTPPPVLGDGRKPRTRQIAFWIAGADSVARYLNFIREIPTHPEGRWLIGGARYRLRYLSMEISEFSDRLITGTITTKEYSYL